MKTKKQIRHVWVCLRLSNASGRDLLLGISKFAKENALWSMRIFPFVSEEASMPDPHGETIDGIITNGPIQASLVLSKIPLVVIGVREPWLKNRMRSLAFVRNDDKAVGALGAKFLLSLGKFRSFGFVPTNIPNYCTVLRYEGFRAELAKRANRIMRYNGGTLVDGSSEDIVGLGKWLAALPKPAAVMPVYDLRATHVLEAAKVMGIKIPDQLAVVGVDNDELLCNLTQPPLTSILPDHVEEGVLAASVLQRLMDGVLSRVHTFRETAKTIVERESARNISPAAHLAEEAMTFIRQNACKGIGSADVAKHLHVSRRLCDLRFGECHGKTVLDAILDVRFDAIKRRLATSKAPIGKITAECGFPCELHAKRMFKKRFGMTMRDWRSANSAKTDTQGN